VTWPDDPRHHYLLHLEKTDDGRYRAFVTVQTVRHSGDSRRSDFFRNEDDLEREIDREERSRVISRLAMRIDLPETYRTRSAARDAGYEAARRFAAGQLSHERVEYKRRVRDYQLIGGAGFRPDVMKWESILTIKRKREASAGGTLIQTIDEINSPFKFNTFPTADRAASFALEYGELMVIGAVSGLKI
jgi:hypothetical protein